jgi:WD40 repeat protein
LLLLCIATYLLIDKQAPIANPSMVTNSPTLEPRPQGTTGRNSVTPPVTEGALVRPPSQRMPALSTSALVSQPSPIKGVRSWDLETAAHRGPITQVAYSPDGHFLATAGYDGTIRLFDPRSHRLQRAFVGHPGVLYALAFSPDGTMLASGNERTIQLWDICSGKNLHTFTDSLGGYSLAWSSDGNLLASGNGDGSVQLWRIRSRESLTTLVGHKGVVWFVAFSPDGRTLASGGSDKTVRLWDVMQFKPRFSPFEEHKDGIYAGAWLSDALLASAGADGTVQLWDAATGNRKYTFASRKDASGNSIQVKSLASSHDGKRLAAGCGDGTVQVWDVASYQPLRVLQHNGRHINAVAWSPDDKELAAGSEDCTVTLWDVATGRLLRPVFSGVRTHSHALAFSLDGSLLATSDSLDGRIRLWETASGTLKCVFEKWHSQPVYALAFSSDGTLLASAGHEGNVCIWHTTGMPLTPICACPGSGPEAYSVAWLAKKHRLLAAGYGDGTVRVWDGEFPPGKPAVLVSQFNGQTKAVRALAWCLQGDYLVSGSDDHSVVVHPVHVQGLGRPLKPHAKAVRALALSPGGDLVSGGADSTVRLWDPATGLIRRDTPASSAVKFLAWLPDNKTVALVTDNCTVEFWKPATGELEKTFNGPVGSYFAMVLSADGRTLACSDVYYNKITLWDVRKEQLLGLVVPLSGNGGMAISPDGHYRATGYIGGLFYVVETHDGQQLLSPDQFAAKFGWKNNPDRVRLISD